MAYYSDLPLDFTANPVSGDVRPVEDAIAIKRALQNLIRTPKGARPFNPEYGCDIQKFLFMPIDSITKLEAANEITRAIAAYEPRVTVIDVIVEEDRNVEGLQITIQLRIGNLPTTLTTSISRNN